MNSTAYLRNFFKGKISFKIKWGFLIVSNLLGLNYICQAQCSSGCSLSYTTCSNIATITATSGTSASNYVVCISPPAGCGNITVGATQLGQYQRLVICTNSPTDTVKFTGNFSASGGGSAASNDNTRFVDVYGNAQITFGGTVVFGSRIVLNVASTGTLDLKNTSLFTFQNSAAIANSGKIISNTDLNLGGPITNSGTIYSGGVMTFLTGSSLTNNSGATVQTKSTLTFSTGSGSVVNNGSLIGGCNLAITSGTFTNIGYVYSGCNTTVSTAITNNSNFKTEGTLTLNASGTFHFQNGLFDTDSLILNGGNIDAGTGCAAFEVHKYSSIQNGSAFTSVPANAVGIYDTGNPGYIDNVSVGCGGSNPAVPYNSGPYCGIIPLSGLGSSGSGCFSSLPVEWLSFSAKHMDENQIRVLWATAKENGNSHFTIQRSNDGMYFSDIGQVIGSGYSSTEKEYYFIDDYDFDGVVFYRIKQIDYNGHVYVSDLIAVNCTQSKGFHFDVFPNPTASEQDINLSLDGIEENSEFVVVLMNQIGTTVYAKIFLYEKQNMLIALSSKDINLPKGIYYISASSNQSVVTKKLVIE